MTLEAQRIAIGKAFPCIFRIIHGKVYWKNDNGLCNPLEDLNAMQSAERLAFPCLPCDTGYYNTGWEDYMANLQIVCGFTADTWQPRAVWLASAAQRAEALLRALGKWKD